MTQFAVPISVGTHTNWTRFDGVSVPLASDVDDTTPNDSDGAELDLDVPSNPDNWPIRFALSSISLTPVAGEYKIKLRFKTDVSTDCQVNVTLGAGSTGYVSFDTAAILSSAEFPDPPLFRDYEYILLQNEVDDLLANSDGSDLYLEILIFNTTEPSDAFKVSSVYLEAPDGEGIILAATLTGWRAVSVTWNGECDTFILQKKINSGNWVTISENASTPYTETLDNPSNGDEVFYRVVCDDVLSNEDSVVVAVISKTQNIPIEPYKRTYNLVYSEVSTYTPKVD